MKTLLALAALVLALCALPAAADPTSDARTLGPVVLRALVVKEGTVTIRVDSGGCTDKASIRAVVAKAEAKQGRAAHYAVTFERVRADDCKAFLPDGVDLEYDVAADLGISGPYTLAVSNPVAGVARPADPDAAVKAGVHAATIRAMETELEGYAAKLKAAEGGVGPEGNAERFRQRIADLGERLAAWRKTDARSVVLGAPEPGAAPLLPGEAAWGPMSPALRQVVEVAAQGPCKLGDTLEVVGMTKSGPFFHVAGAADGALERIQPGTRCRVTLYLVYRREYVGAFPNYAVYLAGVE